MTAAPIMPAMPPQVASTPPTQLAVVEPTMALAPQQTHAMVDANGFPSGNLEQIASALGFEGLDFNAFGIVPNVVFGNKGVFEMSDGSILGEEFYAILGSQRNKFLFSYSYLPEGKPMSSTNMVTDVLYSYDQVNSASGNKTVEQFRQEAALVKSEVEMKVYHEVSATLQDGRIVNLSIPKAGSGTALTRFIVSCVAAKKLPNQVWARIYKGKVVDGPKVKHAFTPWAIDIHGDVV